MLSCVDGGGDVDDKGAGAAVVDEVVGMREGADNDGNNGGGG